MKLSTRIGLPVIVRLTAAYVRDRARTQRRQILEAAVSLGADAGQKVVVRCCGVASGTVRLGNVVVRRHFILRQGVDLLAAGFGPGR